MLPTSFGCVVIKGTDVGVVILVLFLRVPPAILNPSFNEGQCRILLSITIMTSEKGYGVGSNLRSFLNLRVKFEVNMMRMTYKSNLGKRVGTAVPSS